MQNLIEHIEPKSGNALVSLMPPASFDRARDYCALLDVIEDAVVQLEFHAGEIKLVEANLAARWLQVVAVAPGSLESEDCRLPDWLLQVVHKMVKHFQGKRPNGRMPQPVEHRCFAEPLNQHLQLKMHLREASADSLSVICVIKPIDAKKDRTSYLEKRTAKLITYANHLEASRSELHQQISVLKRKLSRIEKSDRYDGITGFPKRAQFLERSGAELQRCRRYGHSMALVVAEILGFDQTIERAGEQAADLVVGGFSQICESAFRQGVDLAGRIDEKRFGILLPETDLAGALLFADRLRALVANTPLKIGGSMIHFGIRIGVDAVQDEDTSVRDMLSRIEPTL